VDALQGPRIGEGTCVEFRDVSKSYDGQHLAVRGMSCSIERGEFLSFLGPSGSGKTTALMMLAGFEEPTSGEILLNARSLRRLPPHRRKLGVVFQNYALFPHMTVAENIAFPLRVRGLSGAEANDRVARSLDLVQLSGLQRRRPAELSGGQQQRVALARALIFCPDVVLMDEPLGALDKQLREQLQLDIKRIQRELGLTIVYVTHDQTEALTMSDRIAIFAGGRILQLSTPRALYDEPESAFVARFVGQNNELAGVVTSMEGQRCIVRTRAGLIIRCRIVGSARVSDAVVATIRPELIALDSSRTESNSFAAVVQDIIYHGDHFRVRIALNESDRVFAKCQQIPQTCSVGARVSVAWRSEDCRAFGA